MLTIRVTDNGIGIPPASIPGLFEMFSQLGAGPITPKAGSESVWPWPKA